MPPAGLWSRPTEFADSVGREQDLPLGRGAQWEILGVGVGVGLAADA